MIMLLSMHGSTMKLKDSRVLTFIPHVILTNDVIFTSVFEMSNESQFLMQFTRRKSNSAFREL